MGSHKLRGRKARHRMGKGTRQACLADAARDMTETKTAILRLEEIYHRGMLGVYRDRTKEGGGPFNASRRQMATRVSEATLAGSQ